MKATLIATAAAIGANVVAADSVQGFDISNYQPNVDFKAAYSSGARFVIIKVCSSLDERPYGYQALSLCIAQLCKLLSLTLQFSTFRLQKAHPISTLSSRITTSMLPTLVSSVEATTLPTPVRPLGPHKLSESSRCNYMRLSKANLKLPIATS